MGKLPCSFCKEYGPWASKCPKIGTQCKHCKIIADHPTDLCPKAKSGETAKSVQDAIETWFCKTCDAYHANELAIMKKCIVCKTAHVPQPQDTEQPLLKFTKKVGELVDDYAPTDGAEPDPQRNAKHQADLDKIVKAMEQLEDVEGMEQQLKELQVKRDSILKKLSPAQARRDYATFAKEEGMFQERCDKSRQTMQLKIKEHQETLDKHVIHRNALLEQAKQKYEMEVMGINAAHKTKQETVTQDKEQVEKDLTKMDKEHQERKQQLTTARKEAERGANPDDERSDERVTNNIVRSAVHLIEKTTGGRADTVKADSFLKFKNCWKAASAQRLVQELGIDPGSVQRIAEMMESNAVELMEHCAGDTALNQQQIVQEAVAAAAACSTASNDAQVGMLDQRSTMQSKPEQSLDPTKIPVPIFTMLSRIMAMMIAAWTSLVITFAALMMRRKSFRAAPLSTVAHLCSSSSTLGGILLRPRC